MDKNLRPKAVKSIILPGDIPAPGKVARTLVSNTHDVGSVATKSVVLKPSRSLLLPEEIPVAQALKSGLAHPPRRVKGLRLPAVPAGMGIFAKWAVKILNEHGEEVPFRHPVTRKWVKKIEGPSHSFTRNFGFWMRGIFQNLDSAINLNETLTDDAGATFLTRTKSNVGNAGVIAIISGLAKIKFGNSSAALSTTQFNLQGVLLGPTTEAAVVVALVVEDSTNTIFTVTGQILNGTGGSFTVEEMGLFPEMGDSTGAANRTTMMLRDLTGPVIVGNGQTIIGQYTFTIAV
jgi:hypothetical protein